MSKKKKPVRNDIKAEGKVYNRKILRNAVKAWAGKKNYNPSQSLHRIWKGWTMDDIKKKMEKQIEEGESNEDMELQGRP